LVLGFAGVAGLVLPGLPGWALIIMALPLLLISFALRFGASHRPWAHAHDHRATNVRLATAI